jgi:integrase/recombinase XerD
MRDTEFRRILKRVRSDKTEATADQYIPQIEKFRQCLNYGHPIPSYDAYIREPKSFEQADAIDIEDWLSELDEYYNNSSSVGKAKCALVAAYTELNKMINAGRISADSWQETPADRADYRPNDTSTAKSRESKEDLHYLKPEQVDELAKEASGKLRDELIIRLLFQTGLRVSELCEIEESDLDPDLRSIDVRGKGRKNRTVYYQPSIDLLIDIWINEKRKAEFYAEDSDYLFPTSRSENISRVTIDEIVREAAFDADLQEVYTKNTDGVELHSVTPHVLRHSFAMACIRSDWDVYTLSQALGHASTEITTSTYLHDDEEQVRNAFKRRGPKCSD